MKNLSYSLGMSMATQLMQTGLENLDVEAFVKAFTEIMKNEKPSMSLEEASEHIQVYFSAKQNEMLKQYYEKNCKNNVIFINYFCIIFVKCKCRSKFY